jgi:hypothetical protein
MAPATGSQAASQALVVGSEIYDALVCVNADSPAIEDHTVASRVMITAGMLHSRATRAAYWNSAPSSRKGRQATER